MPGGCHRKRGFKMRWMTRRAISAGPYSAGIAELFTEAQLYRIDHYLG